MAKEYQFRPLKVLGGTDDPAIAYPARYALEGASQTFKAGAPLKWASGYLVTASTNPTANGTDEMIAGFALEDGHNSTAGAYEVQYLPCIPGSIAIEGNLLTTAAADYVLLATDYGAAVDLVLDGTTGYWYFITAADVYGFGRIVSFKTSELVPNSNEVVAVAGDTNARVRVEPFVRNSAFVRYSAAG